MQSPGHESIPGLESADRMPAPLSSSEKSKPSGASVVARTMPLTCCPRSMSQKIPPASSALRGASFPVSLARKNWMLPSSYLPTTQLLASRIHIYKLSNRLEIEVLYPRPISQHSGPIPRVRDCAKRRVDAWADSLLGLIMRIFTNISSCDEGIGRTLTWIETFLTKMCTENPKPYYSKLTGNLYPYSKLQHLIVVSNFYQAALEARNCGCQMCATLSKLLVFTTFVEAYIVYSLAEAWAYTLDHDWFAAIEKRNKVWLQNADIIANLHHHWDSTWNSSGRRMGHEQVSPSTSRPKDCVDS